MCMEANDDKHPLKEYRDSQTPPLTQEEFGKLFGVTPITVSRWENGTRGIQRKLWEPISEKTGIPIARLIGIPEAAE